MTNPFQIDRMKPFTHSGRFGTILKAAHCDLSIGPNIIERSSKITDAQFAMDMTEIVGWWSVNIYKDIVTDGKGFPGVDCIKYEIVTVGSTVQVLSTDIQGIHNALEYAVACIKANNLDDIAKEQLEIALAQSRRYTAGDPDSAADLTEESNDLRSHSPITFKVDDVPIRVGNDMRIEYNLPDGGSLIVVLTHEGIIMDFWEEGSDESDATSSITYEEQITEMIGG